MLEVGTATNIVDYTACNWTIIADLASLSLDLDDSVNNTEIAILTSCLSSPTITHNARGL